MSVSFEKQFQSLTGFSPMKWQCRLFNRFVAAGDPGVRDIPAVCDIPTGLGKTSVIVIWLLALVRQAQTNHIRLPRRLVYIVNRRTVVDQATSTVERMRHRLLEPDNSDWQAHSATLKEIASTLHGLCASEGSPLGVSTLRGELADNDEWKADPARPAIVIGTIDMIGSKLLFSGYGDGRYGRAHHAGLIGYDALIVHDESHLSPAFNDLLHAVAEEQGREATRLDELSAIKRPVRVMELSATRRGSRDDVFTLEPEDNGDSIVHERITAKKQLYLHPASADTVIKKIIDFSIAHEPECCKVLIYVRTPDEARKVASGLAKKLGADSDKRIALLTGTMRGRERDALVKTDPVYRVLLEPNSRVENTVYLVSTSAGEVGTDLDADHLVCDLTTLDALIQRLGRVNRRGGAGRTAKVDVICPDAQTMEKQSELDRAIDATRVLLQQWIENEGGGCVDVSPQNLRQLVAGTDSKAVDAAFSPSAAPATLTDILLDNWSLTSIDRLRGGVEVGPFLHGVTSEPAETEVVWRREVSELRNANVDEATLGRWFRACRIEAQERLTERTDRVKKVLKRLSDQHKKQNENLQKKASDDFPDLPVVLLDERRNASWSTLSALAEDEANLAYRTVVLPVEAGGLDARGMLDSNADASANPAVDVAEHDTSARRRERWLHRRSPEGDSFERLISEQVAHSLPHELREKERIPLRQAEEGDAESETCDLVLLVSPCESALDNPETAAAQQTLKDHTDAIEKHMTLIADRLDLDEPLRSAMIIAARWHDKGKERDVWQRYARNAGGAVLVAKARSYLDPRLLGGYRHEFGSLLEAMKDQEVLEHAEPELILHLIAAHHGWARPHFEPRSFDSSCTTDANNTAFADVVRHFGRLQQRYGRWGLAWLESLLRCADIAASREVVLSPGAAIGSPQGVPEEVEP